MAKKIDIESAGGLEKDVLADADNANLGEDCDKSAVEFDVAAEDTVDVTKLDTTASKVTYFVFTGLVLLTLLASIILFIIDKSARETHTSHIFLCGAALLLFNVPLFFKRRLRWYIPTVMQIFIIVFIYAHFILGEVQGVYLSSAVFDKILHTTSGLAIAAIGFSLVNILNADSSNTHTKLSPVFVALFSFCFALAVACIWEMFEYFMDSVFGMNMQRYIPPANVAQEVAPRQGYGLIDTMNDIIVSTLSAFAVCLIGFLSLRSKSNFLNKFLIRKLPTYRAALNEAREAGDTALVKKLEHAIELEQKELNEKLGAKGGKRCGRKSYGGENAETADCSGESAEAADVESAETDESAETTDIESAETADEKDGAE